MIEEGLPIFQTSHSSHSAVRRPMDSNVGANTCKCFHISQKRRRDFPKSQQKNKLEPFEASLSNHENGRPSFDNIPFLTKHRSLLFLDFHFNLRVLSYPDNSHHGDSIGYGENWTKVKSKASKLRPGAFDCKCSGRRLQRQKG